MRVEFVGHSCFVVTLPSAVLIFDYSRGMIPQLNPSAPTYVFISHAHEDHFNPEIADQVKQQEHVTYVLSTDIPEEKRRVLQEKAEKGHGGRIVCMDPDVFEEFPELTVRTLKSTDEGVAFILEVDGRKLYFAGDLHWWTWIGESDKDEEMMKEAFIHEMDKIKDTEFDLAFLVLDPRQEERYWWGFDYFMRNTKTRYAFPMHSWGKYALAEQLIADPVTEVYRDKIIPIHKKGEVFNLNII